MGSARVKYLNPKFSVNMPGEKVEWPFHERKVSSDVKLTPGSIGRCARCFGVIVMRNEPHYTPESANRVRKTLCFGPK